MSLVSFTALVLIGFISIAIACSNNSEIKNIIKNAEKGDKMVISGKGSYIWETTNKGAGYQKKILVDFAFDGPKVRWTIFLLNQTNVKNPDSLSIPWEHHTFDGTKSYNIGYARNIDGHLEITRTSIEDKKVISVGFPDYDPIDPRFIGMGMAGEPLGALLKGASKGSYRGVYGKDLKFENLRFLGNDAVDGIECKKIGYTIKDNTPQNWILWLAPSRMYRIIKLEMKVPDESWTGNITYQNFDKNIWFPKQINFEINNNIKTIQYSTQWTFKDDWKINTSLPDSMFIINFPENMQVQNR
jgi:hypothetical protein